MNAPSPAAPRPPRILVLRGGAIGDFILTLPALQALRERWPDAFVELYGYPHIAGLALAGGLVDRVSSLDAARVVRLFVPSGELEAPFRQHLGSFDIALSYLSDVDGVVRDNLRAAGCGLVLYAPPMPEAGLHASDHYVRPLESLALYAAGSVPSLNLPSDSRDKGREALARAGLSGRALIVHPGSGSSRKNWPADRFAELARAVKARGWTPGFLLGEADDEVAAALDRLPGTADIPRLRGGPLLETAALISAARGFLGNDSGISHLAAALGLPTLALFGPTDARTWGPRGPHVRILEAPARRLDQLRTDDVEAAWMDHLQESKA